ncbi:glycine-rich domain-containing protein [Streptomyces albidoflavus]|uniref:glycine-rich domain-containing protein n=1 Tax=Streptomyces albidoflavus TaxID=1886 RepID=UPI00024937C0
MSVPRPDPPGAPLPVIARALITDEQFTAVRSTVLDANEGMTEEMAGRIVEEALKFVAACACLQAAQPGVGLAPSRIVDEGWHALIVHTKLYADLCDSLGGAFVHHYPGYDPTNYDPRILSRTQTMMESIGYTPDAVLWGPPTGKQFASVAAKCQHSGPDCTIVVQPKPKK